jgi:allantoate deiminase
LIKKNEQTITSRIDELANFSKPGLGVTRLPFTKQHKEVLKLITSWATTSGLKTKIDHAGTLIMEYGSDSEKPSFLIGSHQDTVINGGKFDGIMGVLLPLIAIERLGDIKLPFNIEILAFADEEGVRFPTSLIGPRALAGTFDPYVLDFADNSGLLLRDSMRDFGLNPNEILNLARKEKDTLGYLEVHIEQGPKLEKEGIPLGVVEAIAGIERHNLIIEGVAGHAGTTPMELRRDALAASAELISLTENVAKKSKSTVATIGSIQVEPNIVNVIPKQVILSLEIRARDDRDRLRLASDLKKKMTFITEKRGVKFSIKKTYEQRASHCDPNLTKLLEKSLLDIGLNYNRVTSGATHDASAMVELCPISMLFVRCREGLSHNPNEYVSENDMELAVQTLQRFFVQLADEYSNT